MPRFARNVTEASWFPVNLDDLGELLAVSCRVQPSVVSLPKEMRKCLAMSRLTAPTLLTSLRIQPQP